ncbi:DUF6415 family natural product biosynthesis protein [Streptomyces chrestomyceticus]|uniref:DUF6415 family natural product biosynthesis protein n=1 Tax=Streptomyces chrestomyceticus TaxID=68185 RepID=UPI0034042038
MDPTQAAPAPAGLPHPLDVALDADLALRLATGRPTGEVADVLRERLRGYLILLVDDADAYAAALAEGHPKDVAAGTVRHARALARETGAGTDPAASLRLLAKAVHYTARYAATSRQARRQGR